MSKKIIDSTNLTYLWGKIKTLVQTAVGKSETLVIDIASFSSLPKTVSNSNIESDMIAVNMILGTPSAQTGDWTITTANGRLTISGTSAISGSTTVTLYLTKSR